MAFSALGNILLVSSVCTIALSVCIGVRDCGWPSLISVCQIDTTVCAWMNRAPKSASTVDDMTARIICDILRMAPLLIGILSLPATNMWPLARLQDFGSERYGALLWIARTMRLCDR